ncbi:MAG: DNA translocase FtsK [Thermosulfidibacteraceae bacterium]|jgi:S-DNA-T family DNA segregation ATPase FtsK/SpoIIIE
MYDRLKKAYATLLLSLSFYLVLSLLFTVKPEYSQYVGTFGVRYGEESWKNFGVLSFLFPSFIFIGGLAFVYRDRKKLLMILVHTVITIFLLELFFSVFLNGFLAGTLGKVINGVLNSFLGRIGSYFVVITLIVIYLLFLEFESVFYRLLGVREKFKIEEEDSHDFNEELSEEKGESVKKVESENVSEIKRSAIDKVEDEEEKIDLEKKEGSTGIKIVEGEGDLKGLSGNYTGVAVDEPLEEDEEESVEVARFFVREYKLPPVDLVKPPNKSKSKIDRRQLEQKAQVLEEKLRDFGVSGRIVSIHYGPVVSMFEFKPAPGVKISKLLNLQDDIAVAMKAGTVRVVAPIPGRDTVGIELPNDEREDVLFSEIVDSDVFKESMSPLTLILGKDIFGKPFVTDLRKMPHLLVAGATGSGKSVGLNAMICSILYKATPDEVKFILVDPKMLEFSVYNGIPHLITPVITDPKKAATALSWATNEMERRYSILTEVGVRNIEKYNMKAKEKLPYIVIVVDEFADLMMVAGREVELYIARLAQKARASGIHLIIATQRPSVDVITGLIKANFPCRIAFKVSSRVDSRTVLDVMGAEKLLGNGDMLFMPPGRTDLIRLHGAYISDGEIERIVEWWKAQGEPEYKVEEIFEKPVVNGVDDRGSDYDELYDEAVNFVMSLGYASASMLQRHFKIGYNRAARLIEMMEKEGIVGPAQGAKPREVLKRIRDD